MAVNQLVSLSRRQVHRCGMHVYVQILDAPSNSVRASHLGLKDSDMSSTDRHRRIAVIAGAGPAGLTAALETATTFDITPIVFEADAQVGGISKTVNYRGNRMDLGGHRFFSKSIGSCAGGRRCFRWPGEN